MPSSIVQFTQQSLKLAKAKLDESCPAWSDDQGLK